MADRLKIADVAAVLLDMKKGAVIGRYAVGGASAVAFYTEPIATKDLDIFFLFEPPQTGVVLSMEPVYEYCREHGFKFDHEFIDIKGWPVQFVEAGNDPLWVDALDNAVTFSIGDGSIDVLPPEHLAAMWKLVARPKDILKIQHFAESDVLDRVKLNEVIARFDLVETWKRCREGSRMNSNSKSLIAEQKVKYRAHVRSLPLSERLGQLEALQEQSYEILRIREANGGRPIPKGWQRWAEAQINLKK